MKRNGTIVSWWQCIVCILVELAVEPMVCTYRLGRLAAGVIMVVRV